MKTQQAVNSTLIERCNAIEAAADLEPGSVTEAFVEILSGDGIEMMIETGWELSDPDASLAAVRALQRSWHSPAVKRSAGRQSAKNR